MVLQFLKSFKPDGDALLRRISTHVDDATMELIANEDPIGDDSRHARFISALRNIRDGGPLMGQSDFASSSEFYDHDISEILRFTCAAEPDTDLNIQEWRGTRGHWARAFASAVLLRAYADCTIGNHNYVMIQLIESVRRLDAGFEPEAMAALAWFITDADPSVHDIDHDQRAFAGVGLLSFAVDSKMVSPDTVMKLSDWVIAEEKRALDERRGSVGDFPRHWLFRTTFFDTHREKWMAIGAELAACNLPVGDAVRNVGQRLSGQTPMS
jgi:hypothetical protein